MSYNLPKNIQVIDCGIINFKTMGTNNLFVTKTKMIFLGYTLNATSIVGSADTPAFSIGWTATDYNDFNTAASALTATDTYEVMWSSTFGVIPIAPASTQIVLNVTAADGTATTNMQRVNIFAFSL